MNRICQHMFALLRRPLLAMTLILTLLTLTTCGSDEPDWLVGYYLEINSEVRLNLSDDDESQGTSASPVQDVLSATIVNMRTALHDTYPVNDYHGDDAGVIAALDKIYYDYKAMYGATEKNTICIVKINRASMDGEIVVKSRSLKSYRFGARPPQMEE